MATDTLTRNSYPSDPMPQGIPTSGPATHPNGPREYAYPHPTNLPPFPPPSSASELPNASAIPALHDGLPVSKPDMFIPQVATDIYHRSRELSVTSPSTPVEPGAHQQGGAGANHYPSASGVPRLPPILQVEKLQVTTSATQMASASRRRNEAHFVCPVPGCGSTFTRRFNLRGHLRSHTEERPYVCSWPGCKKGFARQHDCKRHQALHTAKSQANVCQGCKKTFSRLDALNRHLRSDNGAECRALTQKSIADAKAAAASAHVPPLGGPPALS